MGPGRRDMQDVDLAGGDPGEASSTDLDGTGPSAPDPAHTPPRSASSPRTPRSPRSKRARRWSVIAIAALLTFVVAGSVTADRRERSRLASLAKVPGILAPLDGAVTDRWHSDVSLWPGVGESEGTLIGVENRPGGGVGVVALDPRTGATLWRAAPRPRGTSDAGTTCTLPSPPNPTVVVCVVADRTMARLVVIDAATGATRSDTPTDTGAAIAAIGPDVVVGYIDPDGYARVARTDALARTQRWAFTSADPVLDDAPGRQDVSLAVTGDLVVVGAAHSSWVLSSDGKLLHSWAADPVTGAEGHVEAVGTSRVAEPATADDGGPATRVVDLTTGSAFTVPGLPVRPMPDDGSLAGLLLAEPPGGSALVAYDLATGRRRWTVPTTADRGVMIVDRRVIRADADSLRSIDGDTGRTVWTTPAGETSQSALFTDGRLVLVAQTDAARDVVLVAHRLDDGSVAWRSDIADDAYLVTVGGRLYGLSAAETVALGPRG